MKLITILDPTIIFIRIIMINLGKKKGKGVELPGPGWTELWHARSHLGFVTLQHSYL